MERCRLKLTVGGYTLSVAESCTGGLIAQRLTEVPGSSNTLSRSSSLLDDAKTRTVGVDPCDCCWNMGSQRAGCEAIGRRNSQNARAPISGLSVTGIAGPGGGSERNLWASFTLRSPTTPTQKHSQLMIPGDRNLIRWRASQAALDF